MCAIALRGKAQIMLRNVKPFGQCKLNEKFIYFTIKYFEDQLV